MIVLWRLPVYVAGPRREVKTLSLFATKSLDRIIAESEAGEHKLKRTLGPMSLVSLGIGAIIGAGLFSLTGLAAAQNAGPAVVLSMVVAAVEIVMITLAVYGESGNFHLAG